MTERELMDEIFGSANVWKGQAGEYPVRWCDTCETFMISCLVEGCQGTSCNGTGCKICVPDHLEFHKLKHSPRSYLSDAECEVIFKVGQLRKLIPISIAAGQKEIDWNWMHEEGQLCRLDYKVFAEELKGLTPEENPI